jgi:hypothetical protein
MCLAQHSAFLNAFFDKNRTSDVLFCPEFSVEAVTATLQGSILQHSI